MNQDMAIIKLQVSVPEAVKAVAEFKQNRIKALQAITLEVKEADHLRSMGCSTPR